MSSEVAMFSTLVESRPKSVRRPAGTIASFIAHYGLILGAVYTSAQATTVGERNRVEKVEYIEPTKVPEIPRNPPPDLVVAPRPIRSDRMLVAPVDIPDVLPEIDLRQPITDPNAFIRPGSTADEPRAGSSALPSDTATLFAFQVERPAMQAPNSASPVYPDILRKAGVEGEVLVSFVVDTAGRIDVGTFRVVRTTHDLFAAAVKSVLPRMRFIPAEVGEKKVRQLVQQPFSFAIVK